MANKAGHIVLTPNPHSAAVTQYLANRKLFPLAPLVTSDVNQAHLWTYYVGAHRFLERHPELTELGTFRAVVLPAELGVAVLNAQAKVTHGATAPPAPAATPAAGKPAQEAPPAPSPRKPARRRKPTTRTTKTDPDKRRKRALRMKAVRVARNRLGKPRRGRKAAPPPPPRAQGRRKP
jgi:hypothetical protein